MKILKTTIVFLFISIFSWGQETNKNTQPISDNDYVNGKKIEEYETEQEHLNQDLRYLDRISSVVKDNIQALSNYSLKDETKEAFFTSIDAIGLKQLERSEMTNIFDFTIKDLANEVNNISFIQDYYFYEYEEEPNINLTKIVEKLKPELDNKKKSLEGIQIRIESTKQSLKSKLEEIATKLTELYGHKSQSTDLHRISILIGLPAFCLTILLLFLVPYFIERSSTTSDPSSNNKQYLLDVATVLLLTLTILILGLAKMINGEVLGTLLGGISGYVLNRNMRSNSTT